MPRLKESESAAKDRLLRALIAKNMAMKGIEYKKDLAKYLNMSDRTVREKIRHPDQFTRLELRMLFSILNFTAEEKEAVM